MTVAGALRMARRSFVAMVAALWGQDDDEARVAAEQEEGQRGRGRRGERKRVGPARPGTIWWNLGWVQSIWSDVVDAPRRMRASPYPSQI